MILPPIPQPMTKVANPLLQKPLLNYVVRSKGRFLPWLARSVHETTGWLPGLASKTPKYQAAVLKRIGAGEAGASRELASAREALESAKTPAHVRRAKAAINRAEASLEWAKTTGGTIPGAAKALTKTPKAVLSSGWRSMGPVQKGMFGYFGVTGLDRALTTPASAYGQPGSEYKNRFHHLGSELGSALAWGATAPLGLVPAIAGFSAGSTLGGLPGRLMGPQQVNPYVG